MKLWNPFSAIYQMVMRPRTLCTRSRVLSILQTQALAFTGQCWTAIGLRITKAGDSIVFSLEEGSESLTLSSHDSLFPLIRMKMDIAVGRYSRGAA